MRDIALESVRQRAAGAGRRSVDSSLSLTAFIDFLLVMVIFLLMSFSANGEIIPDPNIDLPEASEGEPMIDAPLVSVDGNQVRYNGHQVASVREAFDAPGLVRIDGLFEALGKTRQQWRTFHPDAPFEGVCILQIDEGVPSKVVKSVFHTAVMAGYGQVSFMVKPQRN